MLVLPACDDFLDIDPENSVAEDDVDFTATSEMYSAVSGAYAALRVNNMHWVANLLTVIRDGDVWSGRVDDQGDLVTMGNYVYDNSWWGLNTMWEMYYGTIQIANAALESLDNYAEYITSESDMEDYRAYCGEVRIIRAWTYYRLVMEFGAVSIMDSNTQADLTRSTVDVVYEYILRDLEYAMTYTPKMNPNQMEHVGAFTGYTAAGLAAKVYLNMGDYAKVEELTDEIINSGCFELYDDYYQLFKIPGRLCDESLMEVQVTDYGLGSGDEITVDQFFNCCGPTITNPDTYLTSCGGWGFCGYYDDFYDWAIDRGEDVRASTSFMVGGTKTLSGDSISEVSNPSNTNCWNGKWYVPLEQFTEGRTTYGSNNNVRLLRYAEILLMNAEAKVRQGESGDTPFNLVRTRAGMSSITGVDIDDILDERRMELCCEWGDRYNDLIRTGLAESVLGSDGWTEDATYYPIPLSQIDLAPELEDEPLTELIY